jgi:predicted AlkP superfamily phosphohydrolase/phosphomutase
MSDSPRRVLSIGLDGATFDVLTPLMDAGRMPNLRGLRDSGSWGPLRSTVPPLTAPAWASFATGMNPGKHGVFQFFQGSSAQGPRVASDAVVNATSIRAPTLWQRLGAGGLRVGLVNVPMTYPPPPVNGFVVAGTPAPLRPRTLTYPPELATRLRGYRLDLPYFLGGREFQAQYVPAARRLLSEMAGLLEERASFTLRLLREEPWEFFMVVFTETDRLGHYLWPYDNRDRADGVGEAVVAWYERLDAVLGELVAAAGPGSSVLIMSDHGMGPAATRRVYFNDWLLQRGELALDNRRRNLNTWLWRVGLSRDRLARLLRRLPGGFARSLVRRGGQVEVPLDLGATRAYYVPIYEFVGGISIVPRLPELAPGTLAYETLRDRLAAELSALRDPATGEAVVECVYRREELYAGPYLTEAPDLILVLHPRFVGNHRVGNQAVVADRVELAQVRGAHRFDGIFLASGAGLSAAGRQEGLRIEDLAPTILYLLGLPVPEEMDGRVLAEVLDPDLLAATPIRYCDESLTAVGAAQGLAAGEEEEVRRQLEGLGYLG